MAIGGGSGPRPARRGDRHTDKQDDGELDGVETVLSFAGVNCVWAWCCAVQCRVEGELRRMEVGRSKRRARLEKGVEAGHTRVDTTLLLYYDSGQTEIIFFMIYDL